MNYTIDDIIKKTFINQVSTSDTAPAGIMLMLIIAALLGIYIFFIYRYISKKTFYSKSFATSLVAIAMITSIIILTVKSSIVISLGMVGALSIVRYRTPIKEPADLAFVFWAIAVGIICGANLYKVAIIGSLMITIVISLLHYIPDINSSLILLVNLNNEDENLNNFENLLKEKTKYYLIKQRNYTQNYINLIIEIKTKDENSLFNSLKNLNGIINISLTSHDGEVMS